MSAARLLRLESLYESRFLTGLLATAAGRDDDVDVAEPHVPLIVAELDRNRSLLQKTLLTVSK